MEKKKRGNQAVRFQSKKEARIMPSNAPSFEARPLKDIGLAMQKVREIMKKNKKTLEILRH